MCDPGGAVKAIVRTCTRQSHRCVPQHNIGYWADRLWKRTQSTTETGGGPEVWSGWGSSGDHYQCTHRVAPQELLQLSARSWAYRPWERTQSSYAETAQGT